MLGAHSHVPWAAGALAPAAPRGAHPPWHPRAPGLPRDPPTCLTASAPSSNLARRPSRPLQGEILPGFLYLGDRMTAGEADRLNLLGVTHVLNVTQDIPNFYENKDVGDSERRLTYKRCAVKDRIDANIGEHFSGACDFITRARWAPHHQAPQAAGGRRPMDVTRAPQGGGVLLFSSLRVETPSPFPHPRCAGKAVAACWYTAVPACHGRRRL